MKICIIIFLILIECNAFAQSIIRFRNIPTRKWGLIDTLSGKIIMPAKYQAIWIKVNGLYTASLNSTDQLLDSDGKIVLSAQSRIYNYGEIIVLKEKGLYGALDDKLNMLLPYEYSKLTFENGFIIGCLNSKFGIINIHKDTIIPFEYDLLSMYKFEGYVLAVKNNRRGLLDTNAHVIIPLKYDNVFKEKGGFYSVGLNGKYGIYNNKGKLIIPIIWNDLKSLGSNLFAVKNKEGLWGVMDENNNTVLPFQQKEIGEFKNNILSYNNHSNWVGFNMATKKFIPIKSTSEFYFKNGRAAVSNTDNLKALINTKGELLTTYKYDEIEPFTEGYLKVFINNKQGLIDTSGNEIVPVDYDIISEPKGKSVITNKNKKWQFFALDGSGINPNKYDYISFDNNISLILAKKGNYYGLCRFHG